MWKSWVCLGLTIGLRIGAGQATPIGPPIAPPDNISTGSTVPHVDDKKFLKEAALDGMTEIELGKIAGEKASNLQVKQFAQRMIEEYTAAHGTILRIASDEMVAVPKTIDSKHKARVDRLAKLSGAEFDRAYVQDETKQRHQDLKEFTGASQGGNDPNLKNFATSTLPAIEDHINALKILSKAVR
ncbi:MAG TPA: DUF4142 domain-containing protein [Bryobacteraceae bacterium]|nr:DUF4142 domain-containing protein [Bryobacteraceae bacterium]